MALCVPIFTSFLRTYQSKVTKADGHTYMIVPYVFSFLIRTVR